MANHDHERLDQVLAALKAATPGRNALGLYGSDKGWRPALQELAEEHGWADTLPERAFKESGTGVRSMVLILTRT